MSSLIHGHAFAACQQNTNVALGVANAVREEQQHGDFLDTPVCDVAGVQVQI